MQRDTDVNVRNLESLVPPELSHTVISTAPEEQSYQHHDGYHLTSEGLYRESVAAMCIRNPYLRWGHLNYATTPSEYGRATVLEIHTTDPFQSTRHDFRTSQDLSLYLQKKTISLGRHVIILEGLARNYVEALGSNLNMDPALFAAQKRPNSWDLRQFNIERTANLPSLNDSRRSFMIRYPEIRYFPLINGRTQLDMPYVKDIDGHRRINISRRTREIDKYKDSRSGQFDNIVVVNRAASYWSRKYEDGNWTVVLLVDPPTGRMVRTTRTGDTVDGLELKHVLLHGGYLDFIPYPETLHGSQEFIKTAASGPSRVSMLEDICFYFEHHAGELKSSWDDPSIATVFLKKIAASNWVQLTDYFNASAHNLEHHFSRNDSFDIFTIKTIERWWGDLHSWHRRCVQYCEEVNAILVSLRIPPDWTTKNEHEYNAMSSHEDFIWIYNRLLWTKSRFELLMESATGLNAIAGNKEAAAQNERYSRKAREESKHAFREARKASILTFLATVFIPLSVTAGIFSMSSEWAPGGQNFGYYWVITVPLVFLLGGVYYLFGRVPWILRQVDDNELGHELNDLEMGRGDLD